MKLYVECIHKKRLDEAILMSTHKYHYCIGHQKDFLKLSPFAFWHGAMINPHWLELPMSQINFHGPTDVRAIEVLLYVIVSCHYLFLMSSSFFF